MFHSSNSRSINEYSMKKFNVTILGAGNMGTAIAFVLGDNGHAVTVWNWSGDPQPLAEINTYSENKSYLPGVMLPKTVKAEADLETALKKANIVVSALPSGAVEGVMRQAAPFFSKQAIIVDVSKGFHPKTGLSTLSIIQEHVPAALKKRLVSMSGPAIAAQLARRGFTAMNVAAKQPTVLNTVQQVFENSYLRLLPSTDVVGVKVAGAYKNVYAILLGVCDALQYTLNTKSVLLTMALKEIGDVIVASGGKRATAYELAGIGDMIGTGLAHESRNRRFGHCLVEHKKVDKACKAVGQTVEGLAALDALLRLKKQKKLKLPLVDAVEAIVKKGRDPKVVISRLLEKI